MQLSVTRYRSMLGVQIIFLVLDLLINTFVELFRFESVILLVIFVIQDVCLIFSLIIVFLSFFSTYVFQAGLVGYLLSRFRVSIIVSVLYLILSITYHVWSLNVRWNAPMSYWWTSPLLAFYVIHRLGYKKKKQNGDKEKEGKVEERGEG
ncbi:transmembrane protein 138 [Eurytemora carolleeae]|uniref:transmembrane protein 138 n=1 Tax=Eurytemora carolleeae TaxID=1294199 RepID=UPI000C756670|nr:transmembrane protein 138 [Eurytemora carolleeae]|eukprot:XP_023346955.1 transmembrane protein 138-like [Eurytemora affinis]